ncbi:MAG: FAD-binding oxidoreductase [Bacteriovoracaceae bacterium]|nr:FAD-binding oxidoreductase [Bacteroidota bacterium]
MIDKHAIEAFRKDFSGEIILPDDSRYEQASTAYIFKGSPAIVLQPRHSGDVSFAILFAQKHSPVISIRSGGHSGAALGTNNGGVVIDLSLINTIEVLDKTKRLVRIGAGSRWGSVALTLGEHGLAISSGDTVSVGVGGLTLGGGIGWMVRKYGLAIDALVAAEIVTADGRILRASKSENEDLFWALRGGGGNFGIVTHFEFKANPATTVHAGMIIYSADGLFDLIKQWRDCMRNASEDLTTTLVPFPPMMGNPAMVMLMCCFAGNDDSAAKKAIDPLLKIGTVLQNTIKEKPYAEVLEEAHPPAGVTFVVNNGFVRSFSDDLVQIIAGACCKEGSPVLQLRSIGGAMNRVPAEATAFAHRDSEILIVYAGLAPMNATQSDIDRVSASWKTMLPFITGSYVNFFSTATAKDVAAAYPVATYERLAKIKKKYDPQNVFNRNYNVKPAGN